MIDKLHKQARTTPAIRAEIRQGSGTLVELAARYNVTVDTIHKWKHRESVEDRSHTAHRLQTTLTPAQERIAVELRKILRLGLDDLLVIAREFLNPAASRSGLDRCLRRYAVDSLRDLEPTPKRPTHKRFKAYDPSYVLIDVKYLQKMPDESARRYLFVAIDRATRWVLQIKPHKTAAAPLSFLSALQKAAPFHERTVLTDNGSEFTDRLFNSQKQASGEDEFDRLRAALEIEHRLTKPRTLQTNRMVERFNGRISEVLATHRFESSQDLSTTLERYVLLYNPASAAISPVIPDTHSDHGGMAEAAPDLFMKHVCNYPVLEIQVPSR